MPKTLHKDIGTNMAAKLNNLTEKIGHFCSCAFVQIFANLEFIPINFIVFKVPPVLKSLVPVVHLVGGYLSLSYETQDCVIRKNNITAPVMNPIKDPINYT